MHRPSLAGLTALALTGGTLLSAAPAQAADSAVLYVRQQSTACSDTGSGTPEQPFCTIGAAAAAVTDGQWVDVGAGNYRERVTITSSGTETMPIVFYASASATLVGPGAGFIIDGQHDVTLQNLRANGSGDLPALDIRNSSGITIQGGGFAMADGATAPAVRLAGVTSSALKQFPVTVWAPASGLVMDAASSEVYVWDTHLTSVNVSTADHNVGIQVDGSRNTIVGNLVSGFTGAAVAVAPGASGTVVANNQIDGGPGHGIHNRGGAGTAITNNTIRERCLDGIRVDGASTGVSVQNNVLVTNGSVGQGGCGFSDAGAELGVYGDAVRETVIDYNNADHYLSSSPTIYAWNGTRMSLAAFRAASGQAAHDRETANVRDAFDSANSAAPGYQELDRVGRPRIDDPAVPNTGVGPVIYADRGAVETIRSPVARTTLSLDLTTSSVKVDASASEPGIVPIQSFQFTFGDGTTVTQASPLASHGYAKPGEYSVSVKVIGTDGRSDTRTDPISVLRRTATVGLIALSNLRYVAPAPAGPSLQANQVGLTTTGQFDLADAGSGQVAILSRATGTYVTAKTAGEGVTGTSVKVANPEKFTMIRNTDGSISVKSVATNRYLSASPTYSFYLVPDKTTIGPWEKFHRVTVTDAGRSLKARANSKYVTADSAGSKPLIAARTTVGSWERFDVVDLGNGQVALFARADNRFVTAEKAGALPLIANRTTVGAWERFTIIRNSDGTVSLKAAANGRYVSADGAGTKPLIANRTTIGLWEKFTLG